MAGKTFVLGVLLRGRDQISKPIAAAARQVRRFDNAVTRAAASLGTLAAAFLSIQGLRTFFGGAIGSARDFQAQMARVRAVTNATAEQMAELQAAAREAGRTTRFTATQAAEGLEILGRAGVSAADSVQLLPTVLTAAQASGNDLATTAGLITDALGAFGANASEAGRFADVLAKGAQQANTTMRKLGIALSQAGVNAGQMGFTVEETVALLDALAEAGIRGERAGTALRNILAQLADPSSTAREELRKLGIDTENLVEVIGGLNRAGPEASQAILAFGTEAGPALRRLLDEGQDGIAAYTKALEDAEGASAKAASVMSDTLDGAVRGLGSRWDALRRKLVKPLIGRITEEVRALTGVFQRLTEGDQIQRFQRQLVGAFDSVVDAVKAFTRELGGVEGVLGTLTGATEKAAQGLKGVAEQTRAIAGGVRIAFNSITLFLNGVAAAVTLAVTATTKQLEFYAKLLNKIGVVSDAQLAKVQNLAQATVDAWDEAARRVNEDIGDIAAGARQLSKSSGQASDEQAAAAEKAAEAEQKKQEAARRSIEVYGKLVQQIGNLNGAADALNAEFAINRAFEKGRISAEQFKTAMAALERASDGAAGGLRRIQEVNAPRDLKEAGDAAGDATARFEDLQAQLKELSSGAELASFADKVRTAFEGQNISLEQQSTLLHGVRDKYGDAADKAKETGDATQEAGNKANEAADKAQRFGDEAKDAGEKGATAMQGAASAAQYVQDIFQGLRKEMAALSQAALDAFNRRIGAGIGDLGSRADQTKQKVTEIVEELRTLRNQMISSLPTGILRGIQRMQEAALQTRLEYVRQKDAVEGMTRQLEEGRASARLLQLDAETLTDRFDRLDEQDLSGLRSALRSAQAEVRSLEQNAAGTLQSLRDELDRYQEDFVAIERRRIQQQRTDLQAQLAEAQATDGGGQAVRDLRQALNTLRQLEDRRIAEARERQRQAREDAERERRQSREDRVAQNTLQRQATQRLGDQAPTQIIELRGPGGDAIRVGVDGENDARRLVETLQQAGLRT